MIPLMSTSVRGWVANRFYYQIQIPRKDAAILSNCPDREVRRHWIQRVLDHARHVRVAGGIDGDRPGGVELAIPEADSPAGRDASYNFV